MIYLIDGYNVLFRRWGNFSNLKAWRKKLLQQLCLWNDTFSLNMKVIFDGQSLEEDFEYFGSIRVVYTKQSITADEYIIQYIKEHKDKKITVVSSDRELLSQSLIGNAQTQTVDLFWEELSGKDKANNLKVTSILTTGHEKKKKLKNTWKSYLPISQKKEEGIVTNPNPSSDFARWLKVFEERIEAKKKKN